MHVLKREMILSFMWVAQALKAILAWAIHSYSGVDGILLPCRLRNFLCHRCCLNHSAVARQAVRIIIDNA